MQNKICCFFDQAAHYHSAIYTLLDEKLKCDFYISKWKHNPFKQMEYYSLKGFKSTFTNHRIIGNFYWQGGTIFVLRKKYQIYLLNGHPYSLSTWIILFYGRAFKRPIYLWSHGWYGRESPIKVILKKMYFNLATKTFTYGDYARKLMIESGISSTKISCIYNSLDYDKQIAIRSKLLKSEIFQSHFNNNNPTLIFIGRLQLSKNINLLINAIFRCNKEGYSFNLVIVGKEVEATGILQEIENCNLNSQIWLYGECYDEEIIAELLYNAALCVSPGNIGLTAMHSLVYGTPIITHDQFENQGPEFEAIKAGVTGDYFIKDSMDDLCAKIKKWTNIPSEKREIIRTNCYKIIDSRYNPHFQIHIFIKELK